MYIHIHTYVHTYIYINVYIQQPEVPRTSLWVSQCHFLSLSTSLSLYDASLSDDASVRALPHCARVCALCPSFPCPSVILSFAFSPSIFTPLVWALAQPFSHSRARASARRALSFWLSLSVSHALSISALAPPSLLSLFLSFASSPVLLLSKKSLHQQSPHAGFWLAVGRIPWAAKWWWYTPPWRRWMQEPETALTQTHIQMLFI